MTKTFVFRRGSYQVDLRYHVVNGGATPVKLASYTQMLRHSQGNERSMWDPETYSFRGPAYFDGEKYQKLDIEDDEDQALSNAITNGWLAALQHHFVAAIVPTKDQRLPVRAVRQGLDYLLRVVGPAGSRRRRAARSTFPKTLFVGPKLQEQLKKAGPRLELVADYGMLTILAQPLFWLLSKIYEFVGNWGVTIIIVTFLIKLVFYKLAETSGRSMAKMKTVAPRLKAVQERYKDDREGQARAMMELYKREKINPGRGLPAGARADPVLPRVLLGAARERRDAAGAVLRLDPGSFFARSVLHPADPDGRRDVLSVQAESGAAGSGAGEGFRIHAGRDDIHVPVVPRRARAVLADEHRAVDRPAVEDQPRR